MKCAYYYNLKKNKLTHGDAKRLQAVVGKALQAKAAEQIAEATKVELAEEQGFKEACKEILQPKELDS